MDRFSERVDSVVMVLFATSLFMCSLCLLIAAVVFVVKLLTGGVT